MKKVRILIFFIFVILALLAIRTLLFKQGTIGHSWDWLIPPRVDYLKDLFFRSFSTWQNTNLGESRIFQLPSLPFMSFLLAPSFLGLGGDFISKFLMVLTIVLSGFGMFLLLENILRKEWKQKNNLVFPPFLGGFFYAFSPFLFAEFIGGAATQFFAYALFPWLLFFVRKLNQKNNFFLYLLLSSLVLSLITISLQVLVLSSVVLGLYLLVQEKKVVYLKNLVFLYVAYFFFNLYWIIPTGLEFLSLKQIVLAPNFFDPTHIKMNVPALWEIFVATGYWRPLFFFAIKPAWVNIWLFVSLLTVFLMISANLFVKKNRESLFWILVLLLSFIFATGGKEPLGDQVLWLYFNFPLMSLFRSPQHFLVIPIFSFAILLGLMSAILKIEDKKYFRLLLLGATVFWLHPFFVYGDLGAQYLTKEKKDHLDVFQLSPSYNQAFNFLVDQSKEEDFRILFLPMSSTPRYLKNSYQNEGQGGDPLIIYPPAGTLVSDINYNQNSKQLADFLELILYERKNPELSSQVLSWLNMKYVILRKDVLPEFSDNKEIWSPEKFSLYFEDNDRLKKIFSSSDIDIFENLDFKPNLIIFASQSFIYVNNNPSTLTEGIKLSSFNLAEKVTSFSSIPGVKASGIFLEPLAVSSPSSRIGFQLNNRNIFNFNLPAGQEELLVRNDDYSKDLARNPLIPLFFNLDGKSMTAISNGEERGWLSYGMMDFSNDDHRLEIIVPEAKNLIQNGSFEEGLWSSSNGKENFSSEAIDGKKALQLFAQKDSSTAVSQEIQDIKAGATYRVSLWAKTVKGDPPHFSIFQDTDVVREGKVMPKTDRYLEKKGSYQYYEVLLRTNVDTKKAILKLYADSSEEETVVVYDNIKVQRLFDSPLVLRRNEQQDIESSSPKINFKRLNPTKYLVEVDGADKPYVLNFQESFSSNWKVYLNQGGSLAFWQTWFQKPLLESNHYLTNFYANSWLIDKKGNYQLIIEYQQQKLFYLGGIFSILSLIFLLVLTKFFSSKLKKKNNEKF